MGPGVTPASLEFAPTLTVIYGASETGKSYITEAIDYLFGAGSLRRIPESEPYKQMLLGIDLDGDILTLARDLAGGRISVYEGDLRTLDDQVPDSTLSASHKKGNENTVSHFLLDRLSLAHSLLRKNQRNVTVALSFRNISRLVLVGEERMYSRTSPVESGVPTARTSERSTLKLLLEGEDDSGLISGEDPTEFRRLNRAQLSVLDRAIAQARAQLEGVAEQQECVDMLGRVNESILSASENMSSQLGERDEAIRTLTEINELRNIEIRRADEAKALEARFLLLDTQYQTDLQRLEMVRSAGSLLGYFETETCVFCGARSEDQHRGHAIYETAELADSIRAEIARTTALKVDLSRTLQDIRTSLDEARDSLVSIERRQAGANRELDDIENRLQPQQDQLNTLLERRTELDRWIAQWTQISRLEALSSSVSQEQPDSADAVTTGVGRRALDEFSEVLRRILSAWTVPGSDRVEFSTDPVPDVILEGRRRADRGKGIRSVLHAGFTTALGEYCLERGLPHPGFIVLDTPVLTYRDSDGGFNAQKNGDDEHVAPTVAQAFYEYLSTSALQSVVLENQTPPDIDVEGCELVYFSGAKAQGRTGFYPATE
ncbi:MAG: hypothetical protein L0K03_00040 [Bifidobacterium crudilactis]|nr:hypothetical protein [Bifidobacterium crudilactis]